MSTMSRIADAIRSVVYALQTTMMWVWEGGRMVFRAVTAPVRILSNLGQGSGGRGEATAQAAEAAQALAEKQAAEAERQLTAAQTARLVVKAARLRANGRSIEPLEGALPPALLRWVERMSTADAHRLQEADIRVIADYLDGKRKQIPGVRNPGQPAEDELRPLPVPRMDDIPPIQRPLRAVTPEDIILERLRDRLIAAGRQPRDADADLAARRDRTAA